ncbi:MAG: carboxypeptidase-like regulatory domain-containing protein [Candidatus Saccharibacteria bacterium]|nr:carboxypeptidase-like regulatory domain-containing protein [Candidatus Saccharibacteria bacterium]
MKRKQSIEQLPDSPIQEQLEAKVREMLGPDYTSAPPTLDKPAELQAAEDDQQVVAPETDQPEDRIAEDIEEPEDAATQRAVHEIELSESDRILEAEDKEIEAAFEPEKLSFGNRIKQFFSRWWRSPIKRNTTLAVVLFGLAAVAVVPAGRYFVLNTVGVRASSSMTVIDAASQQPIKNATVAIMGVSGQTDSEGRVTLSSLRLGPADLTVNKRAYAQITKRITVGWGSNPLDSLQLVASGEQFTFVVTDYLSGKPVSDAEASVGGSDASADNEGRILLATEPGDDASEVTISAKNYRSEKVKLGDDIKAEVSVKMVPARKSVFVSKRNGKYDLYKIDVDGQNEKLVLAGSGVERSDMALVSHPTDEVVAFVSTRENIRNSDGYLLSTLTVVDLSNDSTQKAAQAERIEVLGWSGSKLYYVQTVAGASAGNPERQKIVSYDYKDSKSATITTANYFNDHVLVGDSLYYAASAAFNPDKAGLYKVGTSGSAQQLQPKEVYGIYRMAYDRLSFVTDNNAWYETVLGQSSSSKLTGVPANPVLRVYTDSPDGSKSVWVDQRDGKGVLLSYNKASKEDTIIQNLGGLRGPVRWLSDKVLVYRIADGSEIADYAFNIEGGEPKKIRDVTLTNGAGD